MKKPRRFQLKEYRDYVRGLRTCAVNPNHRGPWECHHLVKGMGTKGSDLMTVCLCLKCHTIEKTMGRRRLEADYGLEPQWFEIVALKTLAGWVEGTLTNSEDDLY